MKAIEVEYIYNSGFSLETEDSFLVIDYYQGELDPPQDKDLIFLVSHHHYDHYNKKIFDYRERADYILSFDIDDQEEAENIYFMDIDEELELENIFVRSFGSTDEGSSFYIELDGWKIFHAGDLNWWAWEDEGEAKELERERKFKEEIDKLEAYEVDLAFVPLDPRLEKNAHLAGEYIIDRIGPDYFFPMHFKEDYSQIDSFIARMEDYETKVLRLEKRKQTFQIEK